MKQSMERNTFKFYRKTINEILNLKLTKNEILVTLYILRNTSDNSKLIINNDVIAKLFDVSTDNIRKAKTLLLKTNIINNDFSIKTDKTKTSNGTGFIQVPYSFFDFIIRNKRFRATELKVLTYLINLNKTGYIYLSSSHISKTAHINRRTSTATIKLFIKMDLLTDLKTKMEWIHYFVPR
ncbi:MAG: hypothetical protein U9N57_09485 [Pseudomonadota bacterium]|nr:hypothetical protein [Pseudomonadota bacterium]